MMEHIIPEKIFSTEENKLEALSAVKLLTIAMKQGQAIYKINSKNINELQGLSINQDVKNEIKSAVFDGKEVTVSGSNIDFKGWNGIGYIITDLSTGAGAYKISGGSDGSNLMINLVGNILDFLVSDASASDKAGKTIGHGMDIYDIGANAKETYERCGNEHISKGNAVLRAIVLTLITTVLIGAAVILLTTNVWLGLLYGLVIGFMYEDPIWENFYNNLGCEKKEE